MELYRIGTVACDSQPLATMHRIDLDGVFNSAVYQQELAAIDNEVSLLSIPEESGGVNPGDRRAIYCLTRHLNPKSVLEIGTHIGVSTVYIAAALKKLRAINPESSYKLLSVDMRDVNDPVSAPWRQYRSARSPLDMLRSMGCDDLVTFVVMDSLDFFPSCEHRYDLIFLDGSHDASTVYQEIPAAMKLLHRDGHILLHDYFPALRPLWSNRAVVPGPYLATRRLEDEGADIKILPVGKLPWRTKLGSKVTSLALLGKKSILYSYTILEGIL
jgi:predicted O-methyltransferase YrrM